MSKEISPGQTVFFTYDAGKHPGQSRLVYLESTDDESFKGIDLRAPSNDNYRHFKRNQVRQGTMSLVADTGSEAIPAETIFGPRIDLASLPPDSVASAARVLMSPRKNVRYVPEALAVVCLRTDLPRVEVRVGDRQTLVDFRNADGGSLGLELTHAESYSAGRPIFCPMTAEDLRDFGRQLQDHCRSPLHATATAVPGWDDPVASRAGDGGIYGS